MSTCLFDKQFHCQDKREEIKPISPDRINSIIVASKTRLDDIHVTISELAENQFLSCHRSCVSSYTSKHHIGRVLKREGRTERSCSEPPISRKKVSHFEFKKHCLLCGEECKKLDKKNPSRWREVIQCMTTDRPGLKTFKQLISDRCSQRNDKQSAEVRARVLGAIGDLPAADAQYHKDCHRDFFRPVHNVSPECDKFDDISVVVDSMTSDPTRVWVSVDLYALYTDYAAPETCLSRRTLIDKLTDFFGESLLELHIEGCASLLCFKKHLPYKIHQLEQDDSDTPVSKVVDQIVTECKSMKPETSYKFSQFVKSNVIKQTSPTLLSLVSSLVSKGHITKESLSLSQSIQAHVNHTYNATTLGLAVKLHHRFGSKEIVTILHEYGYVSTYEEVVRFRASAAKYTADKGVTSQGLQKDGKPVGSWIDNYDLHIYTPNGKRETHTLVVEFTQPNDGYVRDEESAIDVPRLVKSDLKSLKLGEKTGVVFQHYQGPKNPLPPNIPSHSVGKSFEDVIKDYEAVKSSIELDSKWIIETIQKIDENPIEWSGVMTASSRDNEITQKGTSTDYVFGPMINAQPSHPDTVLTALVLIEQFVTSHGQKYLQLVADMQLFKIAMQVKWSNPNRWKALVVRPGGMHTLMSFIGCVGTLMSGTGLEEILNAAFSGVGSMLNGKAWPKSLRGFRMMTTVLLEDIVTSGCHTPDQVLEALAKARISNMGKLWVDCFITPVLIMHMFVRAEREGNWSLHIHAMERMVPYFFAAGHWNYARFITWHLIDMQHDLPEEIRESYEHGEHVCRHKDGFFNAVWADQFGEQTYIRYGKAKGGLVGMTLNADQVANWVLCNHICTTLSLAMDNMFGSVRDDEFNHKTLNHKEEGTSRRQLDCVDRNKLREEFALYPHPLQIEELQNENQTPSHLSNIVNGCTADDRVNVSNAVAIGDQMSNTFINSLPGGFYNVIHRGVVTMETMKKGVKVGDKTLYDMEKLFSRFIMIADKRKIKLEYMFQYEMAPVPPALFDEYGSMRKTSKAPLVKKLAVLKTNPSNVDVTIIDGNEQIYHVTWPKASTVSVFVQNFKGSVERAMEEDTTRDVVEPQQQQDAHEMYVIFDRYFDVSIKSHERERRTVGMKYPSHKLTMQTLLPTRDAVMKNTSNKKELIHQLCSNVGSEVVTLVAEGQCLFGHEEADVNIIAYLNLLIQQGKKTIQVNADDNDIFVLLVFFVWKWKRPDIFIQMKKFDGTMIDINKSANKLGDACCGLLAAHALTGCDSVSYPFRKGKASAITVIENNPDLQVSILGDAQAELDDVLRVGRQFVCRLYGSKIDVSMSNLRHKIFTSKSSMPPLKAFPPTDDALDCHILRSHLQCILWKAADLNEPPTIDFTKYGWFIGSKGILQPETGITVTCAPELMKVIACGCSSDMPCSRASCSCKAAGISCTSYCKCTGNESCQNKFTTPEEIVVERSDEVDDDTDD